MGKWDNFDDLEDKLTIEELYTLHAAVFRAEHRHNKFMAAMKGVNLDDAGTNERFEDIKARAEAELNGYGQDAEPESEQENNFAFMGISYEADD